MRDKTLCVARGQCTVVIEDIVQPMECRFFQQIQKDTAFFGEEHASHRVAHHEHLLLSTFDFGEALEVGQERAGIILEC